MHDSTLPPLGKNEQEKRHFVITRARDQPYPDQEDSAETKLHVDWFAPEHVSGLLCGFRYGV